MDPLTAIAASGLRARMESLELLANNVANASTGGYKADREFYGLYRAPEADSDSTMPLIERPWIDQSQGPLHATGNPLDVALSGRGFFSVKGPAVLSIRATAISAWPATANWSPPKAMRSAAPPARP